MRLLILVSPENILDAPVLPVSLQNLHLPPTTTRGTFELRTLVIPPLFDSMISRSKLALMSAFSALNAIITH